ncbi:DUF484 domain-containing protein [Proteus terrae]|uniref:DUF484 domain-containing protein n=1 Tax=Proteus terrae TaxID=1574161 RepID=UPI00384EC71A
MTDKNEQFCCPETNELNDQQVIRYLREHPGFFIRNASYIEQMQVPHPVRGTVSLVEWIMSRQRNRIHYLEEDMRLLIEQASENEALFSQLLLLISELSNSASLHEMLERLNLWAKGLGLYSVQLRLFTDRWQLQPPLDAQDLPLSRQAFEHFRIQRMGDDNHYLGTLNGQEIMLLMPNVRRSGSVALTLLGHYGDLGVIIFNSRDNQHFQEGMGTVMLDKLAHILPELLLRWVARQ